MHTLRDNTVIITSGFFIQLAMAVLLLPLNWVFAWLTAALFHELCHYIILRVYKVRIFSLKLAFSGAVIETDPIQPKQEIFAALAGPLGGFLLLPLLHIFPRIVICGFMQSIFNLLPIYPLDGGRVIRGIIACRKLKTPCKHAKVIVQ